MASMDFSSSALNAARSAALTFSSICATLLAPISTEVMVGCRKTHDSAIYGTPAIGRNGVIYIVSDEAGLVGHPDPGLVTGLTAFNPNGSTNFFFTPQDMFYNNFGDGDGTPAVTASGDILFMSEGHRLYSISSSGQLNWFFPLATGNEPDGGIALQEDGSIVCGSDSSYLYNLNPDGSLRWVANMPALGGNVAIENTPVIDEEGNIYTGTGNHNVSGGGNVYSLNPLGGTNWIYTTGTDEITLAPPALAADGTVYDVSFFGVLYAITNGRVAWAFTNLGGENDNLLGGPAILPDGSVVVPMTDDNLYCLWGTAPLATNAVWPTLQQNAAHTGQQSFSTYSNTDECGAPFVFDGTNNGQGDFIFDMTGPPGSTGWNVYGVTNLTNSTWTLLESDLTLDATNGNASFTDSSVLDLPMKFYMVSRSNCNSKVIGFVNQIVAPGTNLIANQLYQIDDGVLFNAFSANKTNTPMNSLNDLFVFATIPWGEAQSGTKVFQWTGTGFVGDTNEFNIIPFWLGPGDITLLPGYSVIMNNTTGHSFTNIYVGLVRDQQIFHITSKTNYLSATVPISGYLTNITGYNPPKGNGDIVQLWSTSSNKFVSYTNTSSGWSSPIPMLSVGEGFVLITTNMSSWTNTWEQ
jgi:hypothetical protein